MIDIHREPVVISYVEFVGASIGLPLPTTHF